MLRSPWSKVQPNPVKLRPVQLTLQNLGNVGQGWRTDTYRALFAGAPDKIHVLTFDYRGFGHSTGSPSEEGLILDGIAAVNWALKVAGIPSSRILLIGHSLGTAVTTAVAEHFVLREGLEFAGVVLVAAFTDIPALMLTYNAGGIVPVLSPLKPYPRIQHFFASRIVDRWMTVERLEGFVKGSRRLHLTLLNAKSDHSIAWQHSQALFYTAVKAIAARNVSKEEINEMVAMEDLGEGGTSYQWTEGPMEVRWELMRHGGRLYVQAPTWTMLINKSRARSPHDICSSDAGGPKGIRVLIKRFNIQQLSKINGQRFGKSEATDFVRHVHPDALMYP